MGDTASPGGSWECQGAVLVAVCIRQGPGRREKPHGNWNRESKIWRMIEAQVVPSWGQWLVMAVQLK